MQDALISLALSRAMFKARRSCNAGALDVVVSMI